MQTRKHGTATQRTKLPVTRVVTPEKRVRKKRKTSKKEISTNGRKGKQSSPAAKSAPSSEETVLTKDCVASIVPDEPFFDLHASPRELRPSHTLTTGQSFHWNVVVKETDDDSVQKASAWGTCDATEWIGVLSLPIELCREGQSNAVAVCIREEQTATLYKTLHAPSHLSNEHVHEILRQYFQLDEDRTLESLYEEWSDACPRLKCIAECIPGVRVMQQDPWECLVSFLCSSNNNIPRITKMLGLIRKHYGDPLMDIPTENGQVVSLYSFPSLTQLSKATEQDLRTKCGMGYRAKYLVKTIELMNTIGGEHFLHNLRHEDDSSKVQEALCQFHGVGRKVADCVALFSLNQRDAIPVDTHVWNVAVRDYGLKPNTKSLTPSTYNQVGSLFQDRFGCYAGWAHSVLFVAELPSFEPLLPKHIVKEMKEFRTIETKKKKKGTFEEKHTATL